MLKYILNKFGVALWYVWHLAQKTFHWLILVNTVMNTEVWQKAKFFLKLAQLVTFSQEALRCMALAVTKLYILNTLYVC